MFIIFAFTTAAIIIDSGRSVVIDFEVDAGAIADDHSSKTTFQNSAALNSSLASLKPGDVLRIPNKTFHFMGGVSGKGLSHVIILIEGTLKLSDDIKRYPLQDDGEMPVDGIHLENLTNVTVTSSGKGTLDGSGEKWWGFIKYLENTNKRPILLHIQGAKDLLIENIVFINAPRFNLYASNLDSCEIRWCEVSARRDPEHPHSLHDLSAFNTDGFDVSGRNVWIHDCTIYNQDDCIAVKKDAENMLFERINASGLGFSIGGLGAGRRVRNITFRNSHMEKTYKGIYIKFVSGREDKLGYITDILYENITMNEPIQWPIWIGPAQQAISGNPCKANPCSLCWPQVPLATCDCPPDIFANITLRNIFIKKPKMSPGVILANKATPMANIVFDNVRVDTPGSSPWGKAYYKCEGVQTGIAIGNTWPVPPCFEDRTSVLQTLV